MRYTLFRSLMQAVGATVLVVILVQVGSAQVMESTNFKMQSDSVNAGGVLSESETYRLEDTAGEVATGNSTSTNFSIKAGYQQMQESYLSLSAIADVLLSPNIGGVSGGTSTGSTTFVVLTDNAAGYTVTVSAPTTTAMRSGIYTIADYVPAGGVPDFVFTTAASQAHLGYSPEGVDIAVRFQDAGSVCGIAGGDTPDRCYQGLTTTPVEIVRRTSSNQPGGSSTTIRFNVGIGANVNVAEGVYTATTTVTALPL